MAFPPTVCRSFEVKHATVGRITSRCLICFATGCVTPLCIHYSLKCRTSKSPCQHLDSADLLHILQCFKKSLAGRRSYSFLIFCLCTFVCINTHNIFRVGFQHFGVWQYEENWSRTLSHLIISDVGKKQPKSIVAYKSL